MDRSRVGIEFVGLDRGLGSGEGKGVLAGAGVCVCLWVRIGLCGQG